MKLPMEVQDPDLNIFKSIYLHHFVEMTCEIIIQYPREIGKSCTIRYTQLLEVSKNGKMVM